MRKVAKFNRPAKGHGNKENRRKRGSEWISFSNCSQRSDRDLEYYLIDCTYLLATELHNKVRKRRFNTHPWITNTFFSFIFIGNHSDGMSFFISLLWNCFQLSAADSPALLRNCGQHLNLLHLISSYLRIRRVTFTSKRATSHSHMLIQIEVPLSSSQTYLFL